jgi:hypothetical protein
MHYYVRDAEVPNVIISMEEKYALAKQTTAPSEFVFCP